MAASAQRPPSRGLLACPHGDGQPALRIAQRDVHSAMPTGRAVSWEPLHTLLEWRRRRGPARAAERRRR